MTDQGCSPTGLHQFSAHVLSSSPSPLHQETPNYTSQYNYHTLSQGHPSLEGHAFEAPSHVTRQDHPAYARPYAQPSSVMDADKVSVTEGRRVSRQDIQLVQNLIERCLQLYMNRKEVIETLLLQAKIEPGFTDLVWQKLEEENKEFFKAYHVRLMVKNQIMIFNKLLQEQVDLMQKLGMSRAPHLAIPNGSHAASLQQQSTVCYAADQTRTDQLHHATIPSDSLVKGTNSVRQHSNMNGELSAHTARMDISQHLFAHRQAHIATVQGSNDIVIKTEPECSSSSMFTFGADNVPEARLAIGDAPIVGFSSIDSNISSLPESLPDPDAMGFLSQIPRNFSLSDLTAGFSHGSDILQNYPGCPYLPDFDGLLDSPGSGCLVDEKRPDTISEGLSYDEFGSD